MVASNVRAIFNATKYKFPLCIKYKKQRFANQATLIQLFHKVSQQSRQYLTRQRKRYQVVASVGFLSQGNYDMSSVSNNVTLCIKAPLKNLDHKLEYGDVSLFFKQSLRNVIHDGAHAGGSSYEEFPSFKIQLFKPCLECTDRDIFLGKTLGKPRCREPAGRQHINSHTAASSEVLNMAYFSLMGRFLDSFLHNPFPKTISR